MKTLKYLSFLLFAFVLSAGFASCSDDDEGVDSSAIVGKWEITWSEGYERDSEDPEYDDEWSEAVGGIYVVFNSDGTGYEEDESDPFTWTLEGDKITVKSKYYTEVSDVVKLTSSEMILEYYEREGSAEYYEKLTFKKVG